MADAAQVVEVVTGGDRADMQLVHPAMWAVSVRVAVAHPMPATVRLGFDVHRAGRPWAMNLTAVCVMPATSATARSDAPASTAALISARH